MFAGWIFFLNALRERDSILALGLGTCYGIYALYQLIMVTLHRANVRAADSILAYPHNGGIEIYATATTSPAIPAAAAIAPALSAPVFQPDGVWGPYYLFVRKADAYTVLMRMGYRLAHQVQDNPVIQVQIWMR